MRNIFKLFILIIAIGVLSGCFGQTTTSLPNGDYSGTVSPSIVNPNNAQDNIYLPNFTNGAPATMYVSGGTNLATGSFTSSFTNDDQVCFTGYIGEDAPSFQGQSITFTDCYYSGSQFTAIYNFYDNNGNYYSGTVTLNNVPSI